MANVTRNTVTVEPDGTHKLTQEEVPAEDRARLDSMVDGVQSEKSAAELEIEEMRASVVGTVDEVLIGGRKRYIKHLPWDECLASGLSVSRDADGYLNLQQKGAMRRLLVAMLADAVFEDAEGTRPYFTRQNLQEYLKKAPQKLLSEWFAQISERNPVYMEGVKNPTEQM
jgi:hypothetical protein